MTSKTMETYPTYVMEACREARELDPFDPSQDAEIMAQSKRSIFWTTVESFGIAPSVRFALSLLDDLDAPIRWPDEQVNVDEVMNNFP